MKTLGAILLFALLTAYPLATADTLRIAVASNFQRTMDQLVAAYLEADALAPNIETTAGSTGKLYAQIKAGAPYSVFFAADKERPLALEQEGLGSRRFTYAFGVLALWNGKREGNVLLGEAFLRSGDYQKIAIANPKLAPYGKASQQVIDALDLQDRLASKLVFGENIAQPFHFAKLGAVDLAFVSLSQLLTIDADHRTYWIPPSELYEPIEQQAILLKDTPYTRAFLRFCQSATARELIETSGYRAP